MTSTWPAPTPVVAPPRAEPRASRVRRAVTAVVAAGVVGAVVGADRPVRTIGAVIAIVAVSVAIVRASLLPRTGRVLIAGAAVGFLPWLAIRSSPWLIVPDLIAAGSLVLLALSTRNGAPFADSLAGYLKRIGRAVVGVIDTPRHVHLGMRTTMPIRRRASIAAVVRPLAIGVTVAGIIAVVLASGDALFASYLDVGRLAQSAGARFAGAAVAMAAVASATGIAIAADDRPPVPSRRLTSPRSAIVAVVPLCAVYVADVAVQASSVLLGADYVRERTGLTFSEYARSGFFQLVGVALATFVGLLALRPTLRTASNRERRALLGLAAVATGCTSAMAVAAIVKLHLYADVFGLTLLRLHTTVFAGWLIVATIIAFASLLRPRGEWVLPVVAVTALCGVFAMNVVDPDRMVAEHNLTSTLASDRFDIAYLVGLSDDAVPSIVQHLDELDAADRDVALRSLCVARRGAAGLDWNLSASTAQRRRAEIC